MSESDRTPITPRNGHTLVVAILATSGLCGKQSEQGLGDQIDHAMRCIAQMFDGPIDLRVIWTKAKFAMIDRPELDQVETALRSRELDFLWLEDLTRLARGKEALRLIGIGVDHGTHCISPRDGLDTRML